MIKMRRMMEQFLRFFVVGVLNTGIDFGIYVALTRLLNVPFVFATIISVTIATITAYIFHKNVTFRNIDPHSTAKIVKFFTVSLIGLFMNAGIVYFGTYILDIYDIYVKISATGVVMFWSFFMHKYWTFKA